jgi:hypothetical protein
MKPHKNQQHRRSFQAECPAGVSSRMAGTSGLSKAGWRPGGSRRGHGDRGRIDQPSSRLLGLEGLYPDRPGPGARGWSDSGAIMITMRQSVLMFTPDRSSDADLQPKSLRVRSPAPQVRHRVAQPPDRRRYARVPRYRLSLTVVLARTYLAIRGTRSRARSFSDVPRKWQ